MASATKVIEAVVKIATRILVFIVFKSLRASCWIPTRRWIPTLRIARMAHHGRAARAASALPGTFPLYQGELSCTPALPCPLRAPPRHCGKAVRCRTNSWAIPGQGKERRRLGSDFEEDTA